MDSEPRVENGYANAGYLYRIIRTIGAGPDLDTILHAVVGLVTEATGFPGCFIWIREGDEHVLRAAPSPYASAEGRVRLSLNEGLVGWAARTRRSVFIRDRGTHDPRVLHVAELHTERFQAKVAVPILSRAGDCIGVIGLQAPAPRGFERHEVEFIEHAAPLVAGAIENARLYEEATGRVRLLTVLSGIAQQIAAAMSTDELVWLVVGACRSLLAAQRCEMYRLSGRNRLAMWAASPSRPSARPLDAAELGLDRPDDEHPGRLARVIWGSGGHGVPLWAPLDVGAERLGILCVLLPHPMPDAQSVLAAIASHAAVALKRHQLIDSLVEENLARDLFEALIRVPPDDDAHLRAGTLRCDLDEPHVVLHAVPWRAEGRRPRPSADWRQATRRLESLLRAQLPRSVFDRRDTSVRALLRVPPTGARTLSDLVRRLHAEVGGGAAGPVAIGLSSVGQGAPAYARRFEEAELAVRAGALLEGRAAVFTYEGLGAYRYALVAEEGVRDQYQQCVERLIEYDASRGADLANTLEVYLELRGNITRTARQLDTHANTLRQRLARIEQLTELCLDDTDWVALAMAIKTVRLRQRRSRSQ